MIRAQDVPGVLMLHVDGQATMAESSTVEEAARLGAARGAALRVDLRDCTTMDSTFSGTLLALKRKLEGVGRTLTLVSPSPKVLELLCEMGLEDFYAIDLADRTVGPFRELPCPPPPRSELRRLVRDAHDELARVPGVASLTFGPVAEELHRDDAGVVSS